MDERVRHRGNFQDRVERVRLRPVQTESDIALVAAAARRIWKEHFPSIIGEAQTSYMVQRFQSEDAIREQMGFGYTYYIITQGGEMLGYTAVVRSDGEPSLMLSKLYVFREHRGYGVGRATLEVIEGTARVEGFTSVVLTVNRHNTSSIAAYRSFGFSIETAVVQDIGAGFVMDDFVMRKPVATCAEEN